MKYDIEFSWGSTYGHAARLVAGHSERGLIVDLGCGAAAIAAPLQELGFDYHGFDHDPEAVDLSRSRGLRCDLLDLRDMEIAIKTVAAAVDNPIRAILLIDVIEHLVDPDVVFQGLARLVDELTTPDNKPLLVTSIPNVAHFDLGAKLLTGRWDVTELGLLDATHVTLFTEERANQAFERSGFTEVARADMRVDVSEQSFPADHPALTRGTPLSEALRSVRDRADGNGATYQFIRCYRRSSAVTSSSRSPASPATQPFCSVILRTLGREPDLIDALTCLAAQNDRDLEVIVVVLPDALSDAIQRVKQVVATFAEAFRDCVTVVSGCDAANSLTIEDAQARPCGRYVALLDDDQLVSGDWIASFREASTEAPGRTVRLRSVRQPHTRGSGADGRLEPAGGFTEPAAASFDLLSHLHTNETPVGSFATPRAAIDALGVRPDDASTPIDDWELVVRLTSWTGVVDHHRVAVTCRDVEPPLASDANLELGARLAADPLLLPPGASTRLAELLGEVAERDEIVRMYQRAIGRVNDLERSRYWRALSPVRTLTASLHRWAPNQRIRRR